MEVSKSQEPHLAEPVLSERKTQSNLANHRAHPLLIFVLDLAYTRPRTHRHASHRRINRQVQSSRVRVTFISHHGILQTRLHRL
jgi:hypothetical protein